MYMTQSRHNHVPVVFCKFNYKSGEPAGNFRKNSRTDWGYFGASNPSVCARKIASSRLPTPSFL